MADLYDRIYSKNPENEEEPEIRVHNLTASLGLIQVGNLTATQVKDYFNMDAAASNDFDALVNLLNGASTKADKLEVLWKIEAVGIAVESGVYTSKIAYKNALGI